MNESRRTDHDLEAMLQSRRIVPHDDNLVQNIVRAAAHIPQRERLWGAVLTIFEEFRLPAPAYSMAVILVLGFVAGLGTFSDINSGLYFDDASVGRLDVIFEEDRIL